MRVPALRTADITAIRQRLSVMAEVIPAVRESLGHADHAIFALLNSTTLPADQRAVLTLVALSGTYPMDSNVDSVAAHLSAGDVAQAHEVAVSLALRIPRRTRRADSVLVSGRLLDVSTTSETIAMTGVPRVVRSLVLQAVPLGYRLLCWRNGRAVLFDGALYMEDSASSPSTKAQPLSSMARLRTVGLAVIRPVRQVPFVESVAIAMSSKLLRLGTKLRSHLDQAPLAILGPGLYVLAEMPPPGVSSRFAPWLRAMPGLHLRTFVHDLLPLLQPEHFPHSVTSEFSAYLDLVKSSSSIVTSSNSVKQELCSAFAKTSSPPQISVLPFGSDASQWSAARLELDGRRTFLMVGGFQPRKNSRLALEAIIRSSLADAQLRLRIVSPTARADRTTNQLIRSARRAGVDVKVHVRVSDEFLAALIDEASASLYLSSREGYGLPVIESLARRTPVIASDIPTNREFLSVGGIVLVPLHDVDCIAQCIVRMASDSSWREELSRSIDLTRIPPGLNSWALQVLDPED